MLKLSDLKDGQSAVLLHFDESENKNVFQEMGIIPGELITKLFEAPLGDPIVIKASDTRLMIRKKDAALIFVATK